MLGAIFSGTKLVLLWLTLVGRGIGLLVCPTVSPPPVCPPLGNSPVNLDVQAGIGDGYVLSLDDGLLLGSLHEVLLKHAPGVQCVLGLVGERLAQLHIIGVAANGVKVEYSRCCSRLYLVSSSLWLHSMTVHSSTISPMSTMLLRYHN